MCGQLDQNMCIHIRTYKLALFQYTAAAEQASVPLPITNDTAKHTKAIIIILLVSHHLVQPKLMQVGGDY